MEQNQVNLIVRTIFDYAMTFPPSRKGLSTGKLVFHFSPTPQTAHSRLKIIPDKRISAKKCTFTTSKPHGDAK